VVHGVQQPAAAPPFAAGAGEHARDRTQDVVLDLLAQLGDVAAGDEIDGLTRLELADYASHRVFHPCSRRRQRAVYIEHQYFAHIPAVLVRPGLTWTHGLCSTREITCQQRRVA